MNKELLALKLFKEILENSDFKNKVFAVGGFVRDHLQNIEAKDLDLVVEHPDGANLFTHQIKEKLGESVHSPYQLGKGYPIWQITFTKPVTYKGVEYDLSGLVVEFADTQKEAFPDPTTRQRITTYGTINEDVKRRDFTVNMLLYDVSSGEIKDYAGGISDLKSGVLRGHPEVDLNKTFQDDPLRMLRLVRFQSKTGWKVPLSVLKTVKEQSPRLAIVSGERIQMELAKVFQYKKSARALGIMRTTNLIPYVFPHLQDLDKKDFKKLQSRLGNEEVVDYAIIFENISPVETDIQLRKLKLDTDKIKQIIKLKKDKQLYSNLNQMPSWEVRKMLRRVDYDQFRQLVDSDGLNLSEFDEKLKEARLVPLELPMPSGDELMKKYSLNPGAWIKKIQDKIEEEADKESVKGQGLSKEDLLKLSESIELTCEACNKKYNLSSKGATLTHGPTCAKKIRN